MRQEDREKLEAIVRKAPHPVRPADEFRERFGATHEGAKFFNEDGSEIAVEGGELKQAADRRD